MPSVCEIGMARQPSADQPKNKADSRRRIHSTECREGCSLSNFLLDRDVALNHSLSHEVGGVERKDLLCLASRNDDVHHLDLDHG